MLAPSMICWLYSSGTLTKTRMVLIWDMRKSSWPSTAITGVDQISKIGLSFSDYAVEGRIDFFEALHLFQPAHVCGRSLALACCAARF